MKERKIKAKIHASHKSEFLGFSHRAEGGKRKNG